MKILVLFREEERLEVCVKYERNHKRRRNFSGRVEWMKVEGCVELEGMKLRC